MAASRIRAEGFAGTGSAVYVVGMLDDVIQKACHSDVAVRSSARDQLRALLQQGTCTHDDAIRLIRGGAAECKVLGQSGNDELPSTIWAASEFARDLDPSRLLDAVEEVFADLNPSGRLCALRVIVLSETRRAAELYVTLLRRFEHGLGSGHFPTFTANAEVAQTLFPAALDLLGCRRAAWHVLHMLLEFRQADCVPPAVAAGHESTILDLLNDELETVRRLQRPSGIGWRDEPPYDECRDMVGLLFDLTGFLSSGELARAVHGAGDLLDPRLRRFRAIAMLRSGGVVADSELAWIAQSPRDRYWLHVQLVQMRLKHRLPPTCRDQALIAEGNLVDWLCYPTELGREPDEIELIHVESRRFTASRRPVPFMSKRKRVDYYFFKYRVTEEHWARERGWLVGMAGGFDRADQPTTGSDGSTFSHFTSLDSKTLRKHIDEYLD